MKDYNDVLRTVEKLNIQNQRIYSSVLGTKKELEQLPKILDKEEPLYMAPGVWKGKICLIVCSDRRVIILYKCFCLPLKIKSIEMDQVYSFQSKSGKISQKLRISDGIETVIIAYCLPSDAERLVTAVRVAKNKQKDKFNQREINFRLRNYRGT